MTDVPLTHFVREAIREKASRELQVLDARHLAIESLLSLRDHLRDARALVDGHPLGLLFEGGRRKKVRKSIEEALALTAELVPELEGQRETVLSARTEIKAVLASVGYEVNDKVVDQVHDEMSLEVSRLEAMQNALGGDAQ